MEVLLLLLDEIDDAVTVLRSLWSRIVGLLLASVLLLATGFAFLSFPQLALLVIALLLSATLLERIRRRRLEAVGGGNAIDREVQQVQKDYPPALPHSPASPYS